MNENNKDSQKRQVTPKKNKKKKTIIFYPPSPTLIKPVIWNLSTFMMIKNDKQANKELSFFTVETIFANKILSLICIINVSA
jgi:hypothetical protein